MPSASGFGHPPWQMYLSTGVIPPLTTHRPARRLPPCPCYDVTFRAGMTRTPQRGVGRPDRCQEGEAMPTVYRTLPKDRYSAYGRLRASGLIRCGSQEATLAAGNEGRA
jgi:hypothetical protein